MSENALAIMEKTESQSLTVQQVREQVNLIQKIMKEVMREGQHYGTIPGCGDKPALLKPGAEKIAMTFRFAPKFIIITKELPNDHREYDVRTELYHIITGAFLGEGVGSCSTMESKYRFRKAEQTCPTCGKPAIIKGKKEYGGGWLCYKKKGGCGAKFKDGDPVIENQEMGRIEYDCPADYYNTCLKMGKKRSLIDAILTATAASDIFTQDIEESPELFGGIPPIEPETESKQDKDPEIRHKLSALIMEMAHGDTDEAKAILKVYSLYKDHDGIEYYQEDLKQISGKWLRTTYGKIKIAHQEWEAAQKSDPQSEPSEKDKDGLFKSDFK